MPLIVIASLTLVYSVLVFSPIPFIAYWRGIWIETAMTTADHQWLATAFIPKGVNDKVMNGKKDTSDVIGGKDFLDETTDSSDTKDASDDTTAPDTIAPDEPEYPYGGSEGDILGQKDLTVGGKDYAGYTVSVNDIEQGIVVSDITGSSYRGKVMLIDDQSRVYLGVSQSK